MSHAEPLLLVDHEEPEVLELNVSGQQPMSTHDDVDLAGADVCDDLILFGLGSEPADHVDLDGEPGEAVGQRLLVLERQDGRRREERDLLAVHDRLERGPHGNFRLPVPHVAAQQAIHRCRRFHVAFDVGDGAHLIGGEIPLERILELALPVRIRAERVAAHGLAGGVELEQLFGHVAHGLLDSALRALPRRAAQLVERRLGSAAVLLDEIEALDGNEQLVVAGIAQLHELLHGVADADLLQPDELPDAVVHVDHEIAHFEIAEVRQERLGNGAMPIAAPFDPGPILLEDVRLGDDLKLGTRKAKPLRELTHRDVRRDVQELIGAVDQDAAQAVLGEQFRGSFGPSFGSRHKEHGIPALAHALDLGDPFLDAPAELDRRLTRDMLSPSSPIASCPGASHWPGAPRSLPIRSTVRPVPARPTSPASRPRSSTAPARRASWPAPPRPLPRER